MSWLKRLTGGGAPVSERLTKLHARGEWAAMLSLAAGQDLDETSRALVDEAGDKLAAINLDQAEICLQAAELARAAEHLELAAGQARSPQLQQRHSQLAASLTQVPSTPEPVVAADPGHDCSSCSGPQPATGTAVLQEDHDLPEDVAWELLLEGLPQSLAERYAAQPPEFCRAVLASSQGDYASATELFRQASGDDDLRAYELALLALRQEDFAGGLPQLAAILEQYPDHEPALQLAVDLALQGQWREDLRPLLHSRLAVNSNPGFCHAALAHLEQMHGRQELFFDHGKQALKLGVADPQLLVGLAMMMEQRGDEAGAEQLLAMLQGGGCHGGVHPLLGELWLRQGRNLDQALESFKAASRQDPSDPRWPMRIGQTYLQRGWRREGEKLLRQLLNQPGLDQELREEITRSLSANPAG